MTAYEIEVCRDVLLTLAAEMNDRERERDSNAVQDVVAILDECSEALLAPDQGGN